jgi:hypothetical protein
MRRKRHKNISSCNSPSNAAPGGILPCFGIVPVEYGALGLQGLSSFSVPIILTRQQFQHPKESMWQLENIYSLWVSTKK